MPFKINLNESAVINEYNKCHSIYKTSNLFKVSITPIIRILKNNDIPVTSSRKYYCNFDFFENIDTEAKAYFLGYLYADGCVRKSSRNSSVCLKLHKKDRDILEKFNISLESSYPIVEEKNTNCLRIKIGSKKMIEDLIKKGCVPNKSLILTFPAWLDPYLLNHFIRGFFDGDGCINITQGISNAHVNFVSSKTFLKELKKILIKYCEIGNTKIRHSGRAFELPYGGRQQILRIGKFLYKNATLYLKRKKDLFDLCDPVLSYTDKIFCDDCLNVLPFIPDNSIDLVVTSPPYNLSIDYDYCKDDQLYKKYLEWLKIVFKQIYRCLKIGGRCVIIIGDKGNGKIATHSDICNFMEHELSFLSMSTIIWKKNNVSNRQSWGTFASPLSPAFPTAHEYILVFAKNTRRLMGKFETDLTKQEFIDWSLAMWELPKKSYNECGYIINSGIHPAPMPEDLIIRCIKMFSWIGAMVLDPFMGIGTVPRVCKKLNRKYIGIEMSPEYVKFAESRLRNMVISEPLFNEEDEKKIWPSEETEI